MHAPIILRFNRMELAKKHIQLMVLMVCMTSMSFATAAPVEGYRFGVFPYLSAVILGDIYAPGDSLNQATHL